MPNDGKYDIYLFAILFLVTLGLLSYIYRDFVSQHAEILSDFLTIFTIVLAVLSIRRTLQSAEKDREHQSRLEAQRAENEILREDIYVTALGVRSSDNFKRCMRQAKGPIGTLKVVSEDKGRTWNFVIIDTTNIFMMGAQDQTRPDAIRETILQEGNEGTNMPPFFRSKHDCIISVLSYFRLKNNSIQRDEETIWYPVPPINLAPLPIGIQL